MTHSITSKDTMTHKQKETQRIIIAIAVMSAFVLGAVLATYFGQVA